MIERAWARLREAYEARLLEDAEGAGRPRRSYLVAAHDPETGESRVVLRGPRALPVGSWFLRPQFLQFGLPVSAIGGLASLSRWLFLSDQLRGIPTDGSIVAILVLSSALGVWWNTVLGGWILSKRWKRLREEAYDTWTFRLEAARGSAPPRVSDTEQRMLDAFAELRRSTLPDG